MHRLFEVACALVGWEGEVPSRLSWGHSWAELPVGALDLDLVIRGLKCGMVVLVGRVLLLRLTLEVCLGLVGRWMGVLVGVLVGCLGFWPVARCVLCWSLVVVGVGLGMFLDVGLLRLFLRYWVMVSIAGSLACCSGWGSWP